MQQQQFAFLDYINAPVFVIEIDASGEPVYAAFNRYAQKTSGLSEQDVIGKTAMQVYPGRMGIAAYNRHKEAAESGEPLTYELWLPLIGEARKVRTFIEPIHDANGKILHLVGTSKDISAEHKVKEVQTESSALTSEIEEFVSMAAHDLRSPMVKVQALADMLRKDFVDMGDGKIKLVGMLETVAKKATLLITDLLSHAQATNARENIVEFEFGELCANTLMMLDPMGNHRAKFDDGWIVGDKTATQIAVRNLIDNALKHCSRDMIEMQIELRQLDDAAYEVTFRDNGEGFAVPEAVFFDSGKFRSESGFGLLGIRRLIQTRGGTISAENSKNAPGAVIRFTLPGMLLDEKPVSQNNETTVESRRASA